MQELNIGGLTFLVEYRTEGGDRGAAVRVFASVDGAARQVLRFDCFEADPHYHYDPTGVNRKYHLDRLTMGCPVEFTLTQIARNVQAMVHIAGFATAAESIDQPAIASRIGELRAAIESVTASVC